MEQVILVSQRGARYSSQCTSLLSRSNLHSPLFASSGKRTFANASWDHSMRANGKWEPGTHPVNYLFWMGVIILGGGLIGFPAYKQLEANHTREISYTHRMLPPYVKHLDLPHSTSHSPYDTREGDNIEEGNDKHH